MQPCILAIHPSFQNPKQKLQHSFQIGGCDESKKFDSLGAGIVGWYFGAEKKWCYVECAEYDDCLHIAVVLPDCSSNQLHIDEMMMMMPLYFRF